MTTATRPLSARQERILGYVRAFIRQFDYAPTVRDIQAGCGLSSTSVTDYNLKRLRKMGYLDWRPDTARSIQLTGLTEPDSATLTFTFTSTDDAARVRAHLGDEPERRLLEMCRAAQ